MSSQLTTRPRSVEAPPVPGGARHVPEGASEQAPSPSQRRFVVGFLGSCLGVLAAILAFNIVIDPFALAGSGIVPTAVESDRSIKLDLLRPEARPAALILGLSRSRQAEPSFLQKLTGHTGFNAGVTGGTSADEYVFVRFAAGLFPHQKRRYIWFTDVGLAGGGVLPQLAHDPRAHRYLSRGRRLRARRRQDLLEYRRNPGVVAGVQEVRARDLPVARQLPRRRVADESFAQVLAGARSVAAEGRREARLRRSCAPPDARPGA